MGGGLAEAEKAVGDQYSNIIKSRGFEPDVVQSAPVKTAEHKQALNWALSNPTDPRAKRILQLNQGAIGTKF